MIACDDGAVEAGELTANFDGRRRTGSAADDDGNDEDDDENADDDDDANDEDKDEEDDGSDDDGIGIGCCADDTPESFERSARRRISVSMSNACRVSSK